MQPHAADLLPDPETRAQEGVFKDDPPATIFLWYENTCAILDKVCAILDKNPRPQTTARIGVVAVAVAVAPDFFMEQLKTHQHNQPVD